MPKQLYFGNTPVPYVASWSAEETPVFLAPCPHAGGRLAISQHDRRRVGKPLFGSPHMNRQREAIAKGLCDTCGKSLRTATKVSLSQARPELHAAQAGDVLQVEPLLHKACAALSLRYCPSLRRQVADGMVLVRQVFQWQAQFAIYSEQGVFEATGVKGIKAVSHAKVQLIKWRDRDPAWLNGAGG